MLIYIKKNPRKTFPNHKWLLIVEEKNKFTFFVGDTYQKVKITYEMMKSKTDQQIRDYYRMDYNENARVFRDYTNEEFKSKLTTV